MDLAGERHLLLDGLDQRAFTRGFEVLQALDHAVGHPLQVADLAAGRDVDARVELAARHAVQVAAERLDAGRGLGRCYALGEDFDFRVEPARSAAAPLSKGTSLPRSNEAERMLYRAPNEGAPHVHVFSSSIGTHA